MTRREFTSSYVSDIEADPFAISCGRCGRRGRYHKVNAIAQYGDHACPDFLRIVSADCPNRKRMDQPCQLVYEHTVVRASRV